MNEIWEDTLKIIKENTSPTPFNTWFNKTTPVVMTDSLLVLQTNDSMTEKILNTSYMTIIEKALASVTGKKFKIIIKEVIEQSYIDSLTQNENGETLKDAKTNKNVLKSNTETYASSPLNPKYVFENFVVGNSNQLAYAASVAVADAPGVAYNPLFLYGNVGLGKTHLMHSIAHHVIETNPNAKVIYCSCETFLNELINAIQNKKTEAFRNKYRKVDMLLIDDIQFIASKEMTQVEFFHTFNTIWELNKQIIISSDRPPKEIPTLEDRLRSRFSCGLIADIQKPDFETRVAILKRKAKLEDVEIPEDVFRFTAKTITSSIRELEGALTKIIAYPKLTNQELSPALAELAIKDMIINSEKQELSVDYIQKVVADYFNISVSDLKGKRRSKNVVYPRHIAMYFCRKLLDLPLSDIGNSFGGRDHSTVINVYYNILKAIENDSNPGVIKNITEIEAILRKD